VQGVFSDSDRKSMQAMRARVTEPVAYQAFQHFITHAPWEARRVWQRLLQVLPDRRGVLILDDTGFPKQGTHSAGVTRQYSGTLGRIANCQVGVTAALWTGVHAWLLGAELYLPETWVTPARRTAAGIPRAVRFQEKWRLALTLIRRVRAAGFEITLVVADAGYGDTLAFRTALDRMRLAYAVGVSSNLTRWVDVPAILAPPPQPRGGRPRTRPRLAGQPRPLSAAAWAARQPRRAWKRMTWRNGAHRRWAAQFVAARMTPTVLWRRKQPLRSVWLVCQRPVGATGPSPQDRYFLSNLPATTTLRALVRAVHQRWAIEQQYQELKDELGLDHFEGRSFAGWHRHVVLTALAYAWLQHERRRRARRPTLPVARAVITEILTAHFFVTQPHYLETMLKLKEIELRI
jgi:SRSO17 transposase